MQPAEARLDSWKEIASYLKRGTRTVQRWEREAGLPVHRLQHEKLGSVYAYAAELDAWWSSRGQRLAQEVAREIEDAPSIAVLPFTDMSQQKDEQYLCDGIAEEIINRLASVRSIRVCSRLSSFRFHAPGADVIEIGRRLSVNAVLEGSIRKSEGRLRITVQLADAENGYQLWSERYDREMTDIFRVQDEIAHQVANALEVRLSPRENRALGSAPTNNPEAYDYYLRGRQYYYQYGSVEIDAAVQMFMQAIALDPEFARAYAGLADCWSYIYLYSDRSQAVREQADWASRKAVEMAPDSAQAQASLGQSMSVAGCDSEAEQAFEKAIRLDPDLFEAYYFYARHSFSRGRPERAIELYESAMRVRPDDFQSPLLAAQIHDDLGQRERALATRRRGVELAEQHLRRTPHDARALYMAANGLVALGDRDRGREWAERSLEMRPEDPMLLYNVGCIYSLLGCVDEALHCLERAAQRGLVERGWYEHDSNLTSVRSHPRFAALVASLG